LGDVAGKLSVIIPALNEETLIGKAIASAVSAGADEVIVADGGSSDATQRIAKAAGAHVIQSAQGRGHQLHAGAQVASGDVLLFLHADAVLPPVSKGEITEHLNRCDAGYFRLCFGDPSLSTRLVAWAANLRSSTLSMPYGDQAIFMRRTLYESLGGFRSFPFLEDLDLVRRLRKNAEVRSMKSCVIVSARKLSKPFPCAPVLLSMRNVIIALLFLLGVRPERLILFYR
jgi:rSAM/selenodomain-associated transferase 2